MLPSKLPINENRPLESDVVDVPACGPSSTSTRAAATGLERVLDTAPDTDSSFGGGGLVLGEVGAPGANGLSPHAAEATP